MGQCFPGKEHLCQDPDPPETCTQCRSWESWDGRAFHPNLGAPGQFLRLNLNRRQETEFSAGVLNEGLEEARQNEPCFGAVCAPLARAQ